MTLGIFLFFYYIIIIIIIIIIIKYKLDWTQPSHPGWAEMGPA
jgi:hypothetical protein